MLIRMELLAEMKQNNHGTYETVAHEKDLMGITTSIKHVVVHFFHKDFRRCMIIDKHLDVGGAIGCEGTCTDALLRHWPRSTFEPNS